MHLDGVPEGGTALEPVGPGDRPGGGQQRASPTYKWGLGFHPLGSWVDHCADGTCGPPSTMLASAEVHSARSKNALEERDQPDKYALFHLAVLAMR